MFTLPSAHLQIPAPKPLLTPQPTLRIYHKCRAVYKFTCKCCDNFYVENTENTHKQRMEQHFQDVTLPKILDENSEYFAAHFTNN